MGNLKLSKDRFSLNVVASINFKNVDFPDPGFPRSTVLGAF